MAASDKDKEHEHAPVRNNAGNALISACDGSRFLSLSCSSGSQRRHVCNGIVGGVALRAIANS